MSARKPSKAARGAAGAAWAAILRRQHPEFRWTVIDPQRERGAIAGPPHDDPRRDEGKA